MTRKNGEIPNCCFGCDHADVELPDEVVWSIVQGSLCLVYENWDLDEEPACARHLTAGSAAKVKRKIGKGPVDVAPGASRDSYPKNVS